MEVDTTDPELAELAEALRVKRLYLSTQPPEPESPFSQILETLGPEPEWVPCACGALVSQPPCWDCDMKGAKERDRDKLAGVPARYAWARPDAPELHRRVFLHPEHSPYSLEAAVARLRGATLALLVGPAQRGKTSLAVAALRGRRCEAFFCRAETLGLSRKQQKYGTGESALVARALETGLLLLDDVGSEGDERDRIQAVRDVLFERLEDVRPTWVTTGLSKEQLEVRYGAGIRARLCLGVVIAMAGPAAT